MAHKLIIRAEVMHSIPVGERDKFLQDELEKAGFDTDAWIGSRASTSQKSVVFWQDSGVAECASTPPTEPGLYRLEEKLVQVYRSLDGTLRVQYFGTDFEDAVTDLHNAQWHGPILLGVGCCHD